MWSVDRPAGIEPTLLQYHNTHMFLLLLGYTPNPTRHIWHHCLYVFFLLPQRQLNLLSRWLPVNYLTLAVTHHQVCHQNISWSVCVAYHSQNHAHLNLSTYAGSPTRLCKHTSKPVVTDDHIPSMLNIIIFVKNINMHPRLIQLIC